MLIEGGRYANIGLGFIRYARHQHPHVPAPPINNRIGNAIYFSVRLHRAAVAVG